MLAKISRTELPETERFGGEWGVLDLPPDMGIAGVIHLRFFDNNIVGVTYNNDGPRPTKLRDYVKDRFGDKYEEFVMKRIIDRDALARLNRIETVKSVEITLTTHNLNYLPPAEGNDYFDVLKQVPNIGDAGVITIGWKTDKRTELLNAAAMKRLIVHLLENRDDLDKRTHIRVNGFDADRHHEDFDLAHDNIVVPEGLLKIGRNREVDAVSAFRAIDEAYDAVSDRFPPQRFVD